MLKKQIKAVQNIMSQANHGPCGVCGKWLGKNGMFFYFCPYYGVSIAEDIPDMPEGIGSECVENLLEISDDLQSLCVPSIAELKETVKGIRRGTRCEKSLCWDFGENMPMVNPWYLIDLLTILPGAELKADKTRGHLSPVYIVSEKGAGVLMPVRKGN